VDVRMVVRLANVKCLPPLCGGEDPTHVSLIEAKVVEPFDRSSPIFSFHETRFYIPRPAQRGSYRILFEPRVAPQGYLPVGHGIAYLHRQDDGLRIVFEGEVNLSDLGEGWYTTSYPIEDDGLVVLLTLPLHYTVARCGPTPIIAKVSDDQRVGVAWAFYKSEASRHESVDLDWQIAELRTDAISVARAINRKILQERHVTFRDGKARQRLINPREIEHFLELMEDPVEPKLRNLQARSMALGRSLDDLKERRDRGRLDDGRYTDLRTDLDRERIEILLELRQVLQGRDPDIDEVLQDAIGGEQETLLMDRLAEVAQRKGLGHRIVDGLNRHKGTIVSWLIEIGSQLAQTAH
jgi:hypothetical protein